MEEMALVFREEETSDMEILLVFFSAHGMPYIVNRDAYQGLKVVDGDHYTALDVALSSTQTGYDIVSDITLYFDSPSAILLESGTTRNIQIRDLPNLPIGTMVLRPIERKLRTKYSEST